MPTVSVPLSGQTIEEMQQAIAQGFGSNKADLARKAIEKYLEDLAVLAVLQAETETPIKGDLDQILQKI